MLVKNLTKLQKLTLTLHSWRVFTNDQITQQAIARRLAEVANDYDSKTNIFYQGNNLPVFIVDFEIVLYLATNKTEVPYSFTAYHKEKGVKNWAVWSENKKSPIQKLIKELPVTGEKLRGDALKRKKRVNLARKAI